MKKKLLCALVIMTCLFSGNTINAQDVKRLIPTNNVIKVNYGPGLVYSTIIDYYERKEYHTSMSLDLSVDYAHTFNKGLGFGINVIQSHLTAIGFNDFYGGASVYYGHTTNNGWYVDASLGLGYAGNDYAEHESGIGIFKQVGAHYKITRHFGIGAELRSLNCYYKKPKNWEKYYKKDGVFGTGRLSISAGLQYYF